MTLVCVFAQECGPLTYPGIVQAVLDKSFDVYIPDLAVIKRIYCEACLLMFQKMDYHCGLKKRVLNVSVCIFYSYSDIDSRDANYYLLVQGY